MDHKSEIEEKLKKAIKDKDREKTSVLRLLLTAIKNKEVEKRRPLSDEEYFSVIRSLIRQHEESIESFKKGGRQDLVDLEQKELEVLKELLPPPLSENELNLAVEEAISELNARDRRDMGRVIKLILEKFSGRVDGKTVSELVQKRLSG